MNDLLAAITPRFRPVEELGCEECRVPILPYDPVTEIRVFQPQPGQTRAWCSPDCATRAGWPWLAETTSAHSRG